MRKGTKTAKWMWYYGDFELYHSIKLHSRRQEFGMDFPPFWGLSNVYPIVRFRKEIVLENDDEIFVKLKGKGRVSVDNAFYPSDTKISVKAGKRTIEITVINDKGLPAAFVDGNELVSDETWGVSLCSEDYVKVGCEPAFTNIADDLENFPFAYEKISPVSVERVNGGVLYDFGKETFGYVNIDGVKSDVTVYYGESKEEAISGKDAILFENVSAKEQIKLRQRAFRYVFLETNETPEKVYAEYEYLQHEDIGSFACDDEIVKKIYDVSAYTFRLCSREFYLDGIKRDRWVWSGDAYQSFMINRYLCADNEIIKRTIIALLGKPPYERHINTINDYSMYLIISCYDYYFSSGDGDFIKRIYSRIKGLFEFIVGRLDENGFVCARKGDWIFIDWGVIDKQGPHCAEQILLYKTISVMEKLAKIAGDENIVLPDAEQLKANIYKFYYKKELGGFIDGYESGKNELHRQQNVFAILYDFASEEEQKAILEKVLLNDEIEEIKTPYFKFFELIALCKVGRVDIAQKMLSSYWGGMLEDGATTFYEQFDANVKGVEKYEMYGNKFAKSLCHAWGSGPIYFLGGFVAGVEITSVGGKTFEVKPNNGIHKEFAATVPVANGKVTVEYKGGKLAVLSTADGGTLVYGGKRYEITANSELLIGK